MKVKRLFMKKILSMQLLLIVILAMIFNIIVGVNTSYAATTYKQEKKQGIDAFPESYKSYLNELKELHSNWTFTAFNTGMTWKDFISKETSTHLRNTVHKSSNSLWKDDCGKIESSYACASQAIIEYYADPRNFLTESSVFQFLEMTYNSSVHTKAGVDSILKGSFMDKTVTLAGSKADTSVKAKISGEYILATPGNKIQDIANNLNISQYKIKDSSNKEISNSTNVATDYIFIDSSNNKTYTIVTIGDINSDGNIDAVDYIRLKNRIAGRTKLSKTQELAADTLIDNTIEATDYIRLKNFIAGRSKIELSSTKVETMSYSEIIMKAAEESGISPYSIAIKIFQEVGRQGSNSVTGTYPGYEGYYNFFNYGAYDSGNAIANGLKYAKDKGWNNQYISIVEGAKLMANSYVSVGQNTAYFYKFDVVDEGKNGVCSHQYMTNIEDPASQAKTLYNTYANNNMLNVTLNFIIPVFNDMPSKCGLPGSIDPNQDTSYYINGTGVNLRSDPTTSASSIGTLSFNEVVTVENFNAGSADGYNWAKIKRANGTTGYVANKYLTKCK